MFVFSWEFLSPNLRLFFDFAHKFFDVHDETGVRTAPDPCSRRIGSADLEVDPPAFHGRHYGRGGDGVSYAGRPVVGDVQRDADAAFGFVQQRSDGRKGRISIRAAMAGVPSTRRSPEPSATAVSPSPTFSVEVWAVPIVISRMVYSCLESPSAIPAAIASQADSLSGVGVPKTSTGSATRGQPMVSANVLRFRTPPPFQL